MKIACISDTHGRHKKLDIPECDVLVHAGDLTPRGELEFFNSTCKWFQKQPCDHVVFIGGNHDFLLQENAEEVKDLVIDRLPENIHYLEAGSHLHPDSVTIDGVKFWGSPWTPWFYSWAFNFPQRDMGQFANAHWDMISEDVDVVISHGPCYRILDQTERGEAVGCMSLKDQLQRVVKPKLHVFGHIHEAYGQQRVGDTLHVNASVLNLNYKLVNDPIVVEI